MAFTALSKTGCAVSPATSTACQWTIGGAAGGAAPIVKSAAKRTAQNRAVKEAITGGFSRRRG
jgi:hypothetical protein